MDLKTHFIKDLKQFQELEKLLNSTFELEGELPEQVFCKGYSNYKFNEFYFALSSQLWPTIQELAYKVKDDFIYMAVLDPHPVDYYYKEFGYFNCVKLPIGLTADDYIDILALEPDESPADAILYNSRKIAWISQTMQWGIWADRAYDICVLAIKDRSSLIESLISENTWRPIDEAVISWISLNFKKHKIPKKFTKELYKNYCSPHQRPI